MDRFWYNIMLLALESSSVINLRLAKISRGGEAGRIESMLMIDEKVCTGIEGAVAMMNGATALEVVALYRDQVAANQLRLSAAA